MKIIKKNDKYAKIMKIIKKNDKYANKENYKKMINMQK